MALDVEKLVELLGSCDAIRINRKLDEWYSIYCPFHNHGQEKKASAGLSLLDTYQGGRFFPAGGFHCFTCGEACTAQEFVQRILTMKSVPLTIRDTILDMVKVEGSTGTDKLVSPENMKILETKFAVQNLYDRIYGKKTEYVSEEELQSYRFVVPYMYNRGLTNELIEKYDIGVDMNFVPPGRKQPVPCITFPVRDKFGNTLFISRRSIAGKNFYLPSKIEKPVYGLYELPKDCSCVVITESCFNCLTSVRYGRPAVALFGTGNPYQIETLKRLGVREFIIGLDPDEAGRRGTEKLKKALNRVAFVWEFEGISEGKDINDLTYDEYWNLNLV